MYWFILNKKDELLQGRTITYLADYKLFVDKSYLSLILNGKKSCSKRLALSIVQCISENAKLEDYFEEREK